MLVVFLLLYLAACCLVAYVARDSIIGFAGYLVLSLVLTPFVMLLVFSLGLRRGSEP